MGAGLTRTGSVRERGGSSGRGRAEPEAGLVGTGALAAAGQCVGTSSARWEVQVLSFSAGLRLEMAGLFPISWGLVRLWEWWDPPGEGRGGPLQTWGLTA